MHTTWATIWLWLCILYEKFSRQRIGMKSRSCSCQHHDIPCDNLTLEHICFGACWKTHKSKAYPMYCRSYENGLRRVPLYHSCMVEFSCQYRCTRERRLERQSIEYQTQTTLLWVAMLCKRFPPLEYTRDGHSTSIETTWSNPRCHHKWRKNNGKPHLQ